MSVDRQRLCAATTLGPCDRPAVAAVHIHRGDRAVPTILIRPDHLDNPELAALSWRCLDCLHDDVDSALAGERLDQEHVGETAW